MSYTRTTTIDPAPGGDTVKQAIIDLDTDLTNAFAHLNSFATDTWTLTNKTLTSPAIATPTFTGQELHAAGSVGAPTIAATGDTNTGIWFPAADTVAVSTAGSERFRVTSSGNMQIGTAQDYGKLYVSNASSVDAGEFRAIVLGGDATTGSARTSSILKNTSTPYDLIFRSQDNLGTNVGSFIFRNGATEQMRITSDGNVLIGTATDPSLGKLHIVGNISLASATTGTAGSVSTYLRVNVNGNYYKIPLHADA